MAESTVCPFCRRESHNPEDVRRRYCGACSAFYATPQDAMIFAVLHGMAPEQYPGEHFAEKLLPDGRLASVRPLTYGRARLSVGPDGEPWYDDNW